MDPLQQLNDQLRQKAHAQEQKARTDERRLTPEERQQKEQESVARRVAQEEIAKAFGAFTIQAGQGASVSGTGRNITVGLQGQTPAGSPPITNGATAKIVVCVENDDATFTQMIASFVNGVLISVQ